VADVAKAHARGHHLDGAPHGLVGHLADAPAADGRLAHVEHAAGVAVPAVLDDRDVDIDDIALLQPALAGNAVADDVVDRGADRLGKTAVIERARGRRPSWPGDVLVADRVELVGRDPGLHVRTDHVEHFRGEAACLTHAVTLGGGLLDGHGHFAGGLPSRVPSLSKEGELHPGSTT
jgi:hypothetical protein